ncbi:kinase-like domain-containing protein [Mycena galericulata]|nr:kinase-like domain-containing protein [Mycena galericulata]
MQQKRSRLKDILVRRYENNATPYTAEPYDPGDPAPERNNWDVTDAAGTQNPIQPSSVPSQIHDPDARDRSRPRRSVRFGSVQYDQDQEIPPPVNNARPAEPQSVPQSRRTNIPAPRPYESVGATATVGNRPPQVSSGTQHNFHDSQALRYIPAVLQMWERRRPLVSARMANELLEEQISSGTSARGTLEQIEDGICTSLASILDSREARHRVKQLQGADAQSFLDIIQNVLDRGSLPHANSRSRARRLLEQLAEVSEQLPSRLFISGINDRDEHPTFGGGFGDVYRASYLGTPVALKRLRTFTADSASRRSNRLQFFQEALVWQELQHPFILHLIGIDRETFPSTLCMVSPWMKYGTVSKYLRDRGRGSVNRLLLEIAQGLEYLHSKSIVHGDLRGTNILISDAGSACLSDFGLAKTIYDGDSTGGALTSSSNHAGSIRWFAPELIAPTAFGRERFARTPATDVYAYGCVCLELYTGGPPFADVTPDVAAMLMVIAGERPEQPADIPDEVWDLVGAAWVADSGARPSISDIIATFPAVPTPNRR